MSLHRSRHRREYQLGLLWSGLCLPLITLILAWYAGTGHTVASLDLVVFIAWVLLVPVLTWSLLSRCA